MKRSTGLLVVALALAALRGVPAQEADEPTSGPAPAADAPNIPAFPGAEGYGAIATGGRGGRVIAVTNLDASGPGSLQAACEAEGPRIVVFRVAGTIEGNISIRNDSITIAGQTAPGDGDLHQGESRHRRQRRRHPVSPREDRPAAGERDGLFGRYNKKIILDHLSASWSTDEVLSVYQNENVTIQWCMITEACPKGDTEEHRFGGIWGNNYGTYHHNLIAHNDSRNPRWASGCGYNDYRNNVLYNWGYASSYGGRRATDRAIGERRRSSTRPSTWWPTTTRPGRPPSPT